MASRKSAPHRTKEHTNSSVDRDTAGKWPKLTQDESEDRAARIIAAMVAIVSLTLREPQRESGKVSNQQSLKRQTWELEYQTVFSAVLPELYRGLPEGWGIPAAVMNDIFLFGQRLVEAGMAYQNSGSPKINGFSFAEPLQFPKGDERLTEPSGELAVSHLAVVGQQAKQGARNG